MRHFTSTLMVLLALTACNAPDGNDIVVNVSGKAQKGPFVLGSSITVFELTDDLSQTGRSFNSQIENNSGGFVLGNVALESSIALLRADGFYYNEVCGELSQSQITLNALVDLGSETTMNLNVLTHLERMRVERLTEEGSSFADAKVQAQQELLAVFGIAPPSSLSASELLDISGSTDGDAILIAISSMIQGYRSESVMAQLMGNFALDFEEDGSINDPDLISDLALHASYLDTVRIAQNLTSRYAELGLSVSVPDFGMHIVHFLELNPAPTDRSIINYPNEWNFLNLTSTQYNGLYHPLKADPQSGCATVDIRISSLTGGCEPNSGCWLFDSSTNIGWYIESYDQIEHSQWFYGQGGATDLLMSFFPGTYLIEYYEAGWSTPTRAKTITVN